MTKLIKLPEVVEKINICKSNIYLKISKGTFPKPIKLGERSVAWLEEEIDNWIEERIKERDNNG